MRLLRDEGCRFIQGYLFSKPMAGDQVAGYLASCEDMSAKATCGQDLRPRLAAKTCGLPASGIRIIMIDELVLVRFRTQAV